MTTVRIIASCHKEIGPFNHNVLFEILKAISPDIIFEELDKEAFDLIYGEQKAYTLEAKAILQYLKHCTVPHKPVDTYPFSDKDIYGYGDAISIIDKNNPEYKKSKETQLKMMLTGGFRFINGSENNKIFGILQQIEIDTLNKIDNLSYSNLYKNWEQITISRENTFINNIIECFKSHKFENAVFITGAEHKYALETKLNLNTLYPDIKWLFGLD